ncbi:ubiquinone biosynthesis protein UbiA [Fulvivirga sp. M361]|uniref:UbiA family prenyltransferase n=1 Tax=Fulvivirga sp. M361 TaxID=2594266 RepID=UPI00117A9F49|nr:UbiA family prenyltransferase [Fulvivirga sp. M361]TRX62707.1 ubiquinone biosynthesis protein UbiA [Fulvivirga sp. M361]
MLKKSTWLHLRIPFSFFLLPVFLFALSVSPNIKADRIVIVFVILHFFLYPASNGYNSYFDKDEKSIGGLKNPPKVSKDLYLAALLFDMIALLLGFMISWQFALMLFIYGMVSKAYSHPIVRIKKYPFTSWFIAGLFQGFFTFLMSYLALNDFDFAQLQKSTLLWAALLSSAILWGSYPMTQIYQHEEDAKRGDVTLSLKLGILGTFHFTAFAFTLASGFFAWYFISVYEIYYAIVFFVAMSPVVSFFGFWYFKTRKDLSQANYTNTMRLNFISSCSLNFFFIYFFLHSMHFIG